MIPYYGRLQQYEKKDTPHLCYLPQIKIAGYTALNEAYILIWLGNHYLMPFNNCFCTIYFFEPFLLFCIKPFHLLYCNQNNHWFGMSPTRGIAPRLRHTIRWFFICMRLYFLAIFIIVEWLLPGMMRKATGEYACYFYVCWFDVIYKKLCLSFYHWRDCFSYLSC